MEKENGDETHGKEVDDDDLDCDDIMIPQEGVDVPSTSFSRKATTPKKDILPT